MDSDEKWYSVKEVAARLSVGCDSVRRWIKRGRLKAFKMPSLSSKRKRIFESFRVSFSGSFVRR
jgi:excisionase family DNA binding protein